MAFQGLSVNVSGDSASAITSLEATQRALSGTDRAADSAADSMEEFGDSVTNTTVKLTGLSGTASGTQASLLGLTTLGLASSFSGAAGAAVGLSTALTGITAAATPLVATLGGVAAAATGLAGGFGAVVGSGLIAFGKERGEQNEERLEQIQARIERLEELEESTGTLTEKQEDQLETLENQEDKYEDLTGVTGGLKDAFSELQDELTPIIVDLGEEFVPLIEDAFDAIPTLARRIVDSLGPLDAFKNALRDAGETAMDAIPAAVEELMDLGREALPAARNLANFLVNNAQPAFEEMVATTKELGPTLVDFGDGVVDTIPKLNDIGTELNKTLIPAVGQTADSVGHLLGRTQDLVEQSGIPEFADTATGALGELFGRVRDTDVFQSLKDTVESDLSAVSTAISQAANGEFDNALGTLVDRATTRVEEVATALAGENGQGGLINNAINDIATFLSGEQGATRIANAAQQAFSSLSDAATAARDAIVGPEGDAGVIGETVDSTSQVLGSIDFSDAFIGLEGRADDVLSGVRTTLIGSDSEGGLVGAFSDSVDDVQIYLQGDGKEAFRQALTSLTDTTADVLSDLSDILIGPDGKTGFLNEMVGAGTEFISQTAPDLFGSAMAAIGTGIRQGLIDLTNPLRGEDSEILDILADGATFATNQAPDLFISVGQGIVNGIIEGFSGLVQGLVGAEDGEITAAFNDVISNLDPVDTFLSVGSDIINGIVDGVQNVAGDLSKAIIGPINGAIETVNEILPGKIAVPQIGPFGGQSVSTGPAGKLPKVPNKVELPEFGPFGGGDVGIPGLPLDTVELAEGGVVTEETLATIGEGGQPEAVVPLDKSDQFGDTYNIDVTVEGGDMSESRLARDLHAEFQAQDI
jgi:TolA-binding protein